ncbi:MAG TPA: beta-N-acetylhexosaminidase [Xanthobacteraceae bacterium]|jgi:beta-N-acetylhexosaminidase
MPPRAFISGLADRDLSAAERSFLRDADPWGVILFGRNVESPEQLNRLSASVREALGRAAPILVDQEGGRVQRLGPPHWPCYPAAAVYGRMYDQSPERARRAAYLGAYLMAADLIAVGIDVDCVPIADVPVPGASSVIGDRAYGETAGKVATIAKCVARGLLQCGVLPVLKHLPGHGRASADSHGDLPVVDVDRAMLLATDFAAFQPLKDLPLGMTAHVVYSEIDPVAPATTSVTVVRDVIRGSIGFSGLLMSDDISMGALSGPLQERARAALAAGCDLVLHCTGNIDEMGELAAAVPAMSAEAELKADAAFERRRVAGWEDTAELRAEWTMLMQTGAA